MDRFAAMVLLLGSLVSLVLIVLAIFSVAPILCSCLLSLLYSLYLFIAYEESGVHHAQEFENRFWTIFALLLATALFFAKDSPIAFGLWWSPKLGFVAVVLSGYAMHVWDRYTHRLAISSSNPFQRVVLRPLMVGTFDNDHENSQGHNNNSPNNNSNSSTSTLLPSRASFSRSYGSVSQSLLHLRNLGIPVEDQLAKINDCLQQIDQLLIPSTINNFINLRHVQAKEREIITVFQECNEVALNFIISHVKLGLLFYKIKDHRNFHGKHRTELIHLLAVERLSTLTVMSRVILLHSLQLLKLRANPKAEYWVRNIILNTHQDDLSELKTLTDAKGDYFCMNKLVYDDIRSETIRQDILHHIRREAAMQQTVWHRQMKLPYRTALARQRGNHKNNNCATRPIMTWRKVLSDVDDTLLCSGGMYPAGVDKRYPKKTVYPGVLAFYRELDLGTTGPDEWTDDRVGNLVFLSARPHLYKDMSEKANFAKFEKLRAVGNDGRKGMHTRPSLLTGDLASGSQYIVTNDFEPLARKKFDNFRRYVNLYPEYQHVFVCDNGQGDVRAGEMMFDSFPYEFEALYVHVVQDICKTHGFNPTRWRHKEFKPVFFRTYPEAALHAASRNPPLIRIQGLQRICQDAVKDFLQIKQWPVIPTTTNSSSSSSNNNTNSTTNNNSSTAPAPTTATSTTITTTTPTAISTTTIVEQPPTARSIVKAERRQELNQAFWRVNQFLKWHLESPVGLIPAERIWRNGEKVRTPYGIGIILQDFDAEWDIYTVQLDWRPLDVQVREYLEEQQRNVKNALLSSTLTGSTSSSTPSTQRPTAILALATVLETDENDDEGNSSDDSPRIADVVAVESISLPSQPPLQQQHPPPRVITQACGEPSAEKPSTYDLLQATTTRQPEHRDSAVVDAVVHPTSAAIMDTTSAAVMDIAAAAVKPPARKPPSKTGQPAIGPIAHISGRCISNFTPPLLPKTSKPSPSIFTFLTTATSSSSSTRLDTTTTVVKREAAPKRPVFVKGEEYNSPFGPVVVVEHRKESRIVAVDMVGGVSGWRAKAFLQEDVLSPIPRNSLLRTLLRQLSGGAASGAVPSDLSSLPIKVPPPLEFPYVQGTALETPFGKGTVQRPLPRPSVSRGKEENIATTITTATTTTIITTSSPAAIVKLSTTAPTTLGVSLDSWTLANGSHPMLYCTEDAARTWKDCKVASADEGRSSIFSSLGSAIVTSSRTLLEPFLQPKSVSSTNPALPAIAEKKKFVQYYKDGAAVVTPFGNGRVRAFREEDGFYEVDLTSWVLSTGRHPVAYVRGVDLRCRVAQGCQEGYPVWTSLGLSGTLASVEPTTGVHIVTSPSAGMVCYLQPECVIRPLKVAVGEDVLTMFGEGKVIGYNYATDIYKIALNWGTGTLLYARADTLDRVGEAVQDRDGPFGVNWLLRLLFFAPASRGGSVPATRSRSNSIVSAKSQKSKN